MEFQTPAHIRHGSNIGQPMTRREGVLKVTGAAAFAADNHPDGMLHAVMAVSTIAKGRVLSLNTGAAKSHPGVVEVMTPGNVPPLAVDPEVKNSPFDFRIDTLQNDGVRYANQPVAVVIAETLEAAAEGARLLAPTYGAEAPAVSFEQGQRFVPPSVGVGGSSHEGEDASIGAAWNSGRSDPDPKPVPRRRLRLERHAARPGGAWDPRGAPFGKTGQTRVTPRSNVRPRQPSRGDTADVADRCLGRWKTDRFEPSHPNLFEPVRRFL